MGARLQARYRLKILYTYHIKFPQIIFVARRAPISRNCYVLPHVFDSLSKVRHLPQISQVGLFNKRARRRSIAIGELKNYPFSKYIPAPGPSLWEDTRELRWERAWPGRPGGGGRCHLRSATEISCRIRAVSPFQLGSERVASSFLRI